MRAGSKNSSKPRGTVFKTSKNAVMLLAGTMIRMIAAFAFIVYCADQLGVEGFGKYTVAVHYFELFLSLTATAVGILLTRDIARWPRHSDQLLTSGILLTSMLSVFGSVAIWMLGYLFGYDLDTRQAMLIASAALIPASICVVFEAVFVTHGRAELMAGGVTLESFLRIGISLWLLAQGFGLIALLWAFLVVRCFLLLVYLWGMQRIGALGWTFSRHRHFRLISRWRMFAAENWMASIYTNLDIIVLSWISGEAAAGIYSAARKVVRLGAVVAKSYTTAIFPVMSRMYTESRDSFSRLYTHSIRVLTLLALPAVAVVSVIPERVIGLLFSSEFDEAATVLRVLIWVLLIDFLNPFLSYTLFAQGRQDRSMRVAAISLAVNSVATYFLVVRYGAVGAALGTLISGSVAMCCYFVATMEKREIRNTFLETTRILIACAVLALVISMVRNSFWAVIVLTSLLVYPILLIFAGAVRFEDFTFFKNTFNAISLKMRTPALESGNYTAPSSGESEERSSSH
ncbi:colanic acid exporter [Novipirellula aureliae]|uniref:Colanic acid exporter n=1 Tax=Novipirellula aureliae TaxID=2527966 RepID=A0A5C6DHZ0_9BACT|nr:flippase [Novipirellula aureliae]TWU35815.1 colanic acid exporter [Novipirellula aureliae]